MLLFFCYLLDYSINHQQPPSQLNNNSPHFLVSHHFNQQTPPIGSTPALPLPLSLNGDLTALQIPAIGSPVVQPVPTSPTTPPPPFPTVVTPATSSLSTSSSSSSSSSSLSTTILSSRLLNDMNDVQNISNILKTCQNGSGSSKGGNHHNNNSSHDKFNSRLDNDSCDRLTNNNNNSNNCNSKEINENSIDDKLVKSEEKPPTTGRQQHRQSKIKNLPASKSNSKSSANTTTTSSVPASTNGLVNNRSAIDVKSKNCLKSVNLNHTNNKTTNNNNSNNNNNNNSSKTTTTVKSSALLPVENGDDTETLDGDEIKTQNQETRTIVFKDIRKYGRDYASLYEHLGLVKGNFDTRFNFIRMCIDEATRFRRKRMADCIQEWWENSLDKVGKSKT